MTRIDRSGDRRRRYWLYALSSSALGILLLIADDGLYLSLTSCMAVTAAASMAIGDARTGLLRNAWTGPLVTAAAIQVVLAVLGSAPIRDGIISGLLGAVAVIGAYIGMGLIGWVGFGDVKFAVGLATIGDVLAGAADIAILPIALLISAVVHAARSVRGSGLRTRAPHGPALAVALSLVIASATVARL